MFDFPSSDKEQFYKDLDALDNVEDEPFIDDGQEESVRLFEQSRLTLSSSSTPTTSFSLSFTSAALGYRSLNEQSLSRPASRRNIHNSNLRDRRSQVTSSPPIVRSTSAPTHILPPPIPGKHPTDRRLDRRTNLKKSFSTTSIVPDSTCIAPAAMTGKRKRPSTAETVPESKQIFKGLMLYFCPNNDVDARRRVRIAKAQQYGGSWVRDWGPQITHIVADKNVTLDWLLTKHLKLSSKPSKVVLVNENYIPECLQFGFLIDPNHSRFRIEGDKQEPPKTVAVNAPTGSASSLQLKPTKKDVLVASPNTPSKTDESSQATANTGRIRPRDVDLRTNSFDSIAEEPLVQSVAYNDALTEAIEDAQAVSLLPVDTDDDPADAVSGSDSESEDERSSKSRKLKLDKQVKPDWQSTFQCMQKHDGTATKDNPNARTIELLEGMAKYYSQVKDDWRTMAYRRAIASLKKCSYRITKKEEAAKLKHIGSSIAEKIEEIVWTDKLRKLDNTKLDSNDIVLQLFMKVYGAGYAQAQRWVAQGHRTLDDLLQNAKLTNNQRIGIDHYEDFDTRIPRSEVEAHGEIVRKALQEIDSEFEATVMGSYRRGARDSGDIDILFTKPNTAIETIGTVVFEALVPRLFETSFLVANLASSRHNDGSKWHGASVLPPSSKTDIRKPIWRRIDFLIVPEDEMGAALIYFTGNDIFNRSLRLLASKKGMRLNQHGLYRDVLHGKGREKLSEGALVEARDEKKIFEVLGVPWRPPHHRIC